MARRKDHSHEQLHTMATDAARELAEEEGLRGITARRIADKIGYSAGTLYNVFENLDDLIVHLNGSTLDGSVAKSGYLVTCLCDLPRGVEA